MRNGFYRTAEPSNDEMRRKIGDVYRIRLSEEKCAFMQHLADDLTQLGGNVVLVIPKTHRSHEEVKAEHITVQGGFYAHVFLKAGETLKIWERVTWLSPAIAEIPVVWADFTDRNRQVDVTVNWKVWRTNGERRAPANQEELDKAEVGLVNSPTQIVHRIEHGAYSRKYPRKGQI